MQPQAQHCEDHPDLQVPGTTIAFKLDGTLEPVKPWLVKELQLSYSRFLGRGLINVIISFNYVQQII